MTLVSAHVCVYNASVGQLYNSEELTSCQKICCRSFLWWSKDFRRKAASCRACEILHIGKPNFIKRRYEEGASTDPPACCWSFFHVYKSTNEQDLPVRKSYEHLIFHNLWLTTCQTLTWVFWWATMIHRSELWLLQDSVFFLPLLRLMFLLSRTSSIFVLCSSLSSPCLEPAVICKNLSIK